MKSTLGEITALILSMMLTISLAACGSGSGGSGGSGTSDGPATSSTFVISNLSYNLQNGQSYDDALVSTTFDFSTIYDISSVTYTFFDNKMNQIGGFTNSVQGGSGVKTGYVNSGFFLAHDFFDVVTFQVSINDTQGFQSNILSGTFKVFGGFGFPYCYPFSNIYHIGGATAIGDLNGDGLSDIAVIGSGYKYYQIFYQNAQGLLDSPVEISTSFYTRGVAIGDVNNDGKLDVALSGETTSSPLFGVISVYLQDTSTGHLLMPQEYNTSFSYIGNPKIADLNSDGKNDIVVVGSPRIGYQGSISIFFQNSSGGLNPEINFSAYRNMLYFKNIDTADMDNDGDNDIVMMKDHSTLAIIKQISPGNYSSVPDLYFAIDPFGIGDINGDGLNDVVYAIHEFNGNHLHLLTQNAQGSFDVGETINIANEAHDIKVYDITRDGLNDIICDIGSTIIVIPQISDHTLGTYNTYYVNNETSDESLSIGDVTGDDRLDAVVSGSDLYVLPFYPQISKQ